ncbi:MAG: hypothetical protein Q9183_003700, partial [Haloplaca sp. 2 TL-2023]
MTDSPLPTPTLSPSLKDKPLPSPPIAQVMSGSIEEPRSLIEASEKPLFRVSPKSSQRDEEWPVLFPQKPTKPDAIGKDSSILQSEEPKRMTSSNQERYPRLSASYSSSAPTGQEASSKIPSVQKIPRKQVSSNNLHGSQRNASASDFRGKNTATRTAKQSDTVPKMLPVRSTSKKLPVQSKPSHRLSAGAAAVEKSSYDTNPTKEPRQTRTSSMRARISAGQIIKESPNNKVLGFTDFTAEKAATTKKSHENLGSAAAFKPRSSSSLSKAFSKKSSTDSLRGTRAPAQFVAGSRRPATRRPSSRNSVRTDSRAASPAFLEPCRPAPSVPTASTDEATRKPYLPISSNEVVEVSVQEGLAPSQNTSAAGIQYHEEADSNKYKRPESEDSPATPVQDPIPQSPAAGDVNNTSVLASIEESPQSIFRSKRISSKSPNFGPTLSISSSADRLIMGTQDANKENHSPAAKKSKELLRAAVTSERKNADKTRQTKSSPRKDTGRPLSSQGFPENRLGSDTTTSCGPQAKKVKSIDLSVSSSPKPKAVSTATPPPDEEQQDIPATDSRLSQMSPIKVSSPTRVGGSTEAKTTGETCSTLAPTRTVSPVKDSATSVSDAIPLVPAFLPDTLQHYVENSDGASKIARLDEVKDRKPRLFPLVTDTEQQQQVPEQSAPSTPKRDQDGTGNDASNPFPPRSSSRTTPPDYTINGSAKSSPTSPLERAAMKLHKEISASERPVEPKPTEMGDFFPPLNAAAPPSRLEVLSSQTILGERTATTKRDSTARDSTKSQSSLSKGLMSKARGLFHHKRIPDHNAVEAQPNNLRSASRNSTTRPTVTAAGSPFNSTSGADPNPTNRNDSKPRLAHRSSTLAPTAPETPAIVSPKPSELSTTTALAMEMLESARREKSSPKKKKLLGMAEIVVDAISQARNAERAFEEAKVAAGKAEMASV